VLILLGKVFLFYRTVVSVIGTKHWLLTVLPLGPLVILRTIRKGCGIRKIL